MRLRGLDQRERLADDGLDAPRAVVGEEADHLAPQHPDVIPEVTEIHADDGLVVVHELDWVEPWELRDGEQRAEPRGAHAARGLREPEADEAAERRETAVALAERTRRVERDVDAAAAGDALDAFLEVLGPIVDAVRDAHLLERLVLRRRRRADDLGACDAAELDRGHADTARGRVDEYAIALRHVAESPQHENGGQVVDRDGGAFLEAHVGRHREHLLGRNRDGIGVATEPRERQDAVARLDGLHARAHLLDDARDFVPDDARRRWG